MKLFGDCRLQIADFRLKIVKYCEWQLACFTGIELTTFEPQSKGSNLLQSAI